MSWPKGVPHKTKRKFSDKAKDNMRKAQLRYWDNLSKDERSERASTWKKNFSKLSKDQKRKRLHKWIEAGMNSPKNFVETSIERKVKDQLKSFDIKFEEQKPIMGGHFIVDFYLPEYRLVIECNGEYWHSLPDRIKRDRELEEYVKIRGRDILWLWENDIKDDFFSISDYLEV